MLDVAFPTSPADVVGDCRAVGADSVGLYVYNASVPGSVRTADFVSQVMAGGIAVLPIIVPGNGSPSSNALLDALRATGFNQGATVLDIETGSSPPAQWVMQALQALKGAGYDVGVYCSPSSYAVPIADSIGAWKWRADWTFRPTFAPGWDAWQYSNLQTVNGRRYDISTVVDSRVFTGADMAQVDEILSILKDSSGADPQAWLRQFLEGLKNGEIATLQASLNNLLLRPQADVMALVAALKADPTFIPDIASAVAKELGKDLSNG